ncbi:MAG: arsenate reductase (glutaredoxin) [Pseudomonadota bacterium]
MSTLVLYHNPRCSKSRAALALLEARGVEHQVIRYLEQPLTRPELESLARQIGVAPRAMMRTKESVYGELGLASAGDEALFDSIAAHPKLLERPILSDGERAVIGRPPEQILTLLDH